RPEQTMRLPTLGDAASLAREALAQREARQQTREQLDALVARYDAQTRALESRAVAVEAMVAALRQLAEEAIWMLNEWDQSIESYRQGTSDGTTAKDLAARLAEIGGAS